MESLAWGGIAAAVATAFIFWFLGVGFLVKLLFAAEGLGKAWTVLFLLVVSAFLFLWLVFGFAGVHWLSVALVRLWSSG